MCVWLREVRGSEVLGVCLCVCVCVCVCAFVCEYVILMSPL